jgi:hypothetical protein
MEAEKLILEKNVTRIDKKDRITRSQNVKMSKEIFDKTIAHIANAIYPEAGNYNKYKLVV